MMVAESRSLRSEMSMTDYYLDKVLPVTVFTQVMSMFKDATTDKDELERLEKMGNAFFEEMEKNNTAMKIANAPAKKKSKYIDKTKTLVIRTKNEDHVEEKIELNVDNSDAQ